MAIDVRPTKPEEYRAASDPLGRFLAERTLVSPYAHVRARELFHAWADWCRACGEEPGSEVTFSDGLPPAGSRRRSAALAGSGSGSDSPSRKRNDRNALGSGGLWRVHMFPRARMRRDIGNAPKPSTLLCTCSYWPSLHGPCGPTRADQQRMRQ